jgi:hypothetical protein
MKMTLKLKINMIRAYLGFYIYPLKLARETISLSFFIDMNIEHYKISYLPNTSNRGGPEYKKHLFFLWLSTVLSGF